MNKFLQDRLIQPVLQLLTQGVTPEKIALSLAFGIMLGLFPVAGTTSLLCLAAALIFRLNVPAVQLVNFLMYPLWFALVIPFVRLGERIFGVAPLAMSVEQMLAMAKANLPHAVNVLWQTAFHAAVAWMLVGPLGIVLLYFILVPVIRRLAKAQLVVASR
jgi:uncharacterized protein (DUF2062 family)